MISQRKKYVLEKTRLEKELDINHLSKLRTSREKWKKEMESLIQQRSEITSRLVRLQALSAQHLQYAKYAHYLEEENNRYVLSEQLCQVEREIAGLEGLEATGKEAEVLAVEETVRGINAHAALYLEKFFDKPVVVQLQTERETRTGNSKLQMNTLVEYENIRYDCIDEMSGGERRKCELAFLLGVNDMLGSRFLALDENLTSLDEEALADILMFLRLVASSRLILVIGHGVVAGYFDEEIVIE